MMRLVISAVLLTLMPHNAMAQDVPGIEICTAEKTMERAYRLPAKQCQFPQNLSDQGRRWTASRRVDAANRQIDALKATVIGLQNTVAQLQGQVQALGKQPNGAAKDAPKETPKGARRQVTRTPVKPRAAVIKASHGENKAARSEGEVSRC